MFRKKISNYSSKHNQEVQKSAFDESFWQWYVDSYGKAQPTGKDNASYNTKKYHHNSSVVTTLIKYFDTLKLPTPSMNEIISLLKSPFTQGDIIKTFHLIRFFQLSSEGLFLTNVPYDKLGCAIQYVGAENWENVMCYLDALLYSMFSSLESFEPILFISNHENMYVNQLAAILRVYVSLIRSGNMVTTDLTTRLCEILMKLGFHEAMSHKQQDSAALFQFLTDTLSMPMLTFKIDIKHGGKRDKDDQKYSNERILFVSIPEDDEDTKLQASENSDSEEGILLEECLEHYFNNSISVKRELERRATLESLRRESNPGGEISYQPSTSGRNLSRVATDISRSQPIVEDINIDDQEKNNSVNGGTSRRLRSDSKNSIRQSIRTRSSTLSIWSINDNDTSTSKEVSLPAWMFLRLLPFYTDINEMHTADGNIQSIAKNSKEFVNRRPILPICLKRYSYNDSKAQRSQKRIIIPPIINIPRFIADDDDDAAAGDFKLILESAVCHKGTTITLGHFISVTRKNTYSLDETDEEAYNAPWYLYDDMKKKARVVEKSFKDIFNTEWPYMLFYRLVSNDDSNSITNSPNGGSIRNRSLHENIKPIVVPHGAKGQWLDHTNLLPIISTTPSYDDLALSSRKQSVISTTSSTPIPDISPTDPRFVDIRDKYFWYVTDKDKNYYKEEFIHSKDSQETTVSLSPYYRRNSQWSETSNISSINPLPKKKDELSDINNVVDDLNKLTLTSTASSGNISYWKRSKKPKADERDIPDNINYKKNYVESINFDDMSSKSSLKSNPNSGDNTNKHLSRPQILHRPNSSADTSDADEYKKSRLFGKKYKRKRDEYKKEKCIIM